MKKSLIVLTTLFSLTGCSQIFGILNSSTSNQASSENLSESTTISSITSEITSQTSNTSVTTLTTSNTSIITTASSENASTSETPVPISYSIKEINDLCNMLSGEGPNIIGETLVSFTCKMKFAVDSVATSEKNGYRSDNKYKLFCFDNTGSIYVAVNTDRYTNVFSKYEYQDTSYYTFTGTIAKYHGVNEVIMSSYTWLENYTGTKFEDSLIKGWAIEKSYSEIYSMSSTNALNIKGISYTNQIVKFNGYCLDQDLNSASALFGNNEYVMRIHGDNKLHNSLKTDSSYTVYGVICTHLYKGGIQYLCSETLKDAVEVTTTNATTLETCQSIYAHKYDSGNDSSDHATKYETIMQKIIKVEGYINEIDKGGKTTFCLADNIYSTTLSMTNCGDQTSGKKTIVFSNKNLANLASNDTSPLDGYDENTKYTFYIAVDIYNTSHYFQANLLFQNSYIN